MIKKCKNCNQQFTVTENDLSYYQEIDVPVPTFCSECRQQRRLIWRNERNLYLRKCDATGKAILSVFSENKKFPIYDSEYWYSDNWNPLDYGQDFDFNRPFFEQFEELMNKVPQLTRSITNNENCDFVNQCGWCKNCYLIFEADFNENCMYSHNIQESLSCVDNFHLTHCELCYECVDSQDCYNIKFSQDCKNCSDSWFLKNCIGCRNCFGCVNLKNKEYYFLNEKCTKEEYEEKFSKIDYTNYESLQDLRKKFSEFVKKFPQKYMEGSQNEDSTGNYLYNTQRCQECFDVNNAQDCKFVFNSRNTKKVYDMTVFGSRDGAEFCYENHEIGSAVRNIFFSDQVWIGCYDIYYSKLCINSSHNLFGCVGLKKKSYCIFNKEYSPEEYETLKSKIIEHMKKTHEWGEFFPKEICPYYYNETSAQEYFPLTQKEAIQKGYKWKEHVTEESKVSGENIHVCQKCSKNYKIIDAETKFYQKMELPIPDKCHNCRHAIRFKLHNPHKLYHRNCQKCQTPIETTFSPERPEIVYCDPCYLESLQ